MLFAKKISGPNDFVLLGDKHDEDLVLALVPKTAGRLVFSATFRTVSVLFCRF